MDQTPPDTAHRCLALARSPGLAVLLDLDGTLIPFADSPEEAGLDDAAAAILQRLVATGVQIVVVSGRRQQDVERVRERFPRAWWVAEHGAWRRDDDGWSHVGVQHPAIEQLADRLGVLAAGTLGARVERKSASVCLHWRRVPEADRAELVDVAEQLADEWLETHPVYERIAGVDLLEVRASDLHKGTAVAWVRARGVGPFFALGDDVTDEDMFRALAPTDVAIVVGQPGDRTTCAALAVGGVLGVRQFLRWLGDVRTDVGSAGPPPVQTVEQDGTGASRVGLLVISNRTPAVTAAHRRQEVGGLVGALAPALRDGHGMWLGWSGQQHEGTVALRVDRASAPARASFDLTARQRRLFYGGFCNRSLWPMLHGLPGRVRYEDDEWAEYVATSEVFARLATELVAPDGSVWIHDYHLFLVARELRRRGHDGPIGLFVHVPFPARDVVETVPWARELVEGMLGADLIGFHTGEWVRNFAAAANAITGAHWDGARLVHGGHATTVAAFPIAIDAAAFRATDATAAPDVEGLRAMLGDRKLILGVDRLDYSKGIPERLESFERLLERYPRWRGQASFVQVSVPSRAEVPEYAELKARVEHLVGRINGHFGEADWVPVRYLYRSYGRDVLAQLYRLADVAMVTPLRDGMNLVAKEFVAAQDDASPGVLVLSRFAGAADELGAAILTNPFHRDGMAADLDHALALPADERRARQRRLRDAVERATPASWADAYLAALAETHQRSTRIGGALP